MAFSSCSNDTRISVTDNDSLYKLDAEFDDSRTTMVQEYFNDFFRPTKVIALNSGNTSQEVMLPDQTKFKIEVSKGEIHLQFNKKENNPKAYAQVKAWSKGLGRVVTEE
ncbi:hypothetical protein BWI96_07240 [Siphonobacter sp. SORGH_AS_0500]|nr:hypothetical protein BWI96_07240 [Siphonobacter sp. SORGH_AS_0500]